MTDQSATIITPPNAPTVGARPYWLPDTRGFLAVSIVAMIFLVVMTLLWHPVQVDEKMFTLLSMLLGILVKCFTDVYSFSFSTTQEGTDKNKTIAGMSASLANSVPATVVVPPLPIAPAPSPGIIQPT